MHALPTEGHAHACRSTLRWSQSRICCSEGVLEKTKKRNAVVPAPRAGCLAEPGWRLCLGCEVGIISGISLSHLRPDTATNKLARPVRPVLLAKRGKQHTTSTKATHGTVASAPYMRSYAARSHARMCQLAVIRDQKRKKMLSFLSATGALSSHQKAERIPGAVRHRIVR